MDAVELLKQEGVRSYMVTHSGQRLYIENCPGVSFIAPKRGHQAAYIDLTDMSIHCRTFSRTLNAKQCKAESTRVERELTPLAKRLAALEVGPRGPLTRFCQSVYLGQLFASAGVDTSRLATMLILDAGSVGDAVNVSVREAQGYRVSIIPKHGSEQWNTAHLTEEDLRRALGKDPMKGCSFHVQPITQSDPFTERLLKWGAMHLARIAGAYTGPIPRTANQLP